MNREIYFPISICFEDGEVEQYENIEELVTGVEDFNSDKDVACHVTDKFGRPVRLKISLLDLKELSLT